MQKHKGRAASRQRGELDLVPVRWLAIELQPGPALALSKGEFTTTTDRLIHTPSPVAFQLGVGATASF